MTPLILSHDPGEHQGWAVTLDRPSDSPTRAWPWKRKILYLGNRLPDLPLPFIFVTEQQYITSSKGRRNEAGRLAYPKRSNPTAILRLSLRCGIALGQLMHHPMFRGAYYVPVLEWKGAISRSRNCTKEAFCEQIRRQLAPDELRQLAAVPPSQQWDPLDAVGIGQAWPRLPEEMKPKWELTKKDGLYRLHL